MTDHVEVLQRLVDAGEKANGEHWQIGGPYPGVSVIYCVDGGCTHPDNAYPPEFEAVCILDQKQEGEPNKQAIDDAAFIVAAGNARASLKAALTELEALRAVVARLPKTADGKPICIGDTVWFPCDDSEYYGVPWDSGVGFAVSHISDNTQRKDGWYKGLFVIGGDGCERGCDELYSTKEACEAAQGGSNVE